MWITIIVVAIVIGLALTTVGLRGRRADDHPLCRRCRCHHLRDITRVFVFWQSIYDPRLQTGSIVSRVGQTLVVPFGTPGK